MAGKEEASGDVKGEAGAEAAPRTIEIDGATANVLQERAAALGISVAELLAMIVGSKPAAPPPAADEGAPPAASESASKTAAARWREVKDWIDSWGKPDERPRPKLGK